MEKIIQISYQGRNISIEETAYNTFQQYENELKSFFLKEEGGEETFADLQYRMAEILEQKNLSTSNAVNAEDITELIDTIGKPSDLDTNNNEETSQTIKQSIAPEKKKLFRNKNKNEKVIAGVCSGIAHYFSIDPVAVRLAFVLFTIFNIATILVFPLGLAAYILLWIILEPAYIKTNIHRKLFRNPKDKVIGGVCSGIAQFFNTETWIIRLIFLAPFILGLLSNHTVFGHLGHNAIGHFFYSSAFISYLLLWVIVPVAKSSTDYMLLKGEPINISTIQNPTSMEQVTQNSRSGLSKFFKIIAYILIAIFLMFMIPVAISILIGSIFSYNLADIALFSSFNKTLALFTILFFIALPLLGIVIWLIRKIAGYRQSNRPLRLTFVGLHILGWVSAVLLFVNLFRENNTYVSRPVRSILNVNADTLYVEPAIADTAYSEHVIFEFNQFDNILKRNANTNDVKAVRLKYKQSPDSNYHIEIEKSAFGRNRYIADENAMAAMYESNVVGNTLYLPSMVSVSNKMPYHFQNIKVTIFVPKHKVLIVSDKMKHQLQHRIRTDNKNFEFHSETTTHDDEIVIFEKDNDPSVITIDDNTIRINDDADDAKREAKQDLEEAQREAKLKLEEAQRELEETNREAQRSLDEAKREAQLKMEEAKRELEQSKREAQQKIEDAKH